MIAYKLIRQDMTTYNSFKWEVGITYTIDIPGTTLCSNQVFHAYKSPEIAVLLNPIHADYRDPLLFEIHCDMVADDGLKIGSKQQTLVRQIDLPVFSPINRAIFAILCAKKIYNDADWNKWADDYLNNINRADADAYAYAAYAAAYAAHAAYAAYAAYAADAYARIDIKKIIDEAVFWPH